MLVRNDLVQAVGFGVAGARSTCCRGRGAQVEQLVHALGQLLRGAVVHRLDPHVLSRAAHVDFLHDAHQAAHLRSGVRDDQELAGRVHRNVAVLALELPEQGHRLGYSVDDTGVGWVTTPPLSMIFKKRPCGTIVMPLASKMDKKAW